MRKKGKIERQLIFSLFALSFNPVNLAKRSQSNHFRYVESVTSSWQLGDDLSIGKEDRVFLSLQIYLFLRLRTEQNWVKSNIP